jgi:hypothetical protein
MQIYVHCIEKREITNPVQYLDRKSNFCSTVNPIWLFHILLCEITESDM